MAKLIPSIPKINSKSVKKIDNFVENIIDGVREPLLLLDKNYKVLKASRSFYDSFKVKPAETIGTSIYDLGNGQWNIPELRELLEVILPEKTSFDNYKIEHDFTTVGKRILLLNARKIQMDLEKEQVILLAIEDITNFKRKDETFLETEQQLKSIYNTVDDVIFLLEIEEKENYRFISVNSAFFKVTGIPREAVVGKRVNEIIREPSLSMVLEKYRKAIAENTIEHWKETTDYPNGRLTGDVSIAPVFDSTGNCTHLVGSVHDVTKRKLAEEALLNNETLISTIVQAIPDLIWLKDVDGVYLACNKMLERFFGATEAEIVGKSDYDFVNHELADSYREHDRKSMAAGKPTNYVESATFADDGHQIFLDIIKTPVFDSHGMLIGVLGIGRDITEHKRTERVIRESEKLFKAIFDQAPVAIALLDMDGHPIVSNLYLSKMVGYSSDELSEMKFTDFTYPDDADIDLNQFKDLLLGKISSYSMEKRYVHKNGKIIWANLIVTILRDENGISQQIIGMAEDITERKLAEEKLRESERRYKELTILLPQSVFESDINGTITFANDFVSETFGYSKEEVLNIKSLQEIIIPEEKEYLADNMKRIFSSEGTIGREYTLIKKDLSTFPALVYSNPIIRDGKHVGIRGVLTDISEIKKTQQDLIEAKERAESANRLKDAFIANISHEIRTPLNGILGMSSIIRETFSGKMKKEDEELFVGIDISSRRIIRTIDMILNYSRLQVGEFPVFPKPLELSSLCMKLVSQHTADAKSKLLELTFQNNFGDVQLFVDEFSVSTAISNLIDNAIKYTPIGFVKLSLHKGINDNIILDVIDTGIGISEGQLEKIFEPYRQEQMGYGREYEGVGLGLSLAKKVLDLNNAIITVKSKKGKGTIFTINFGKVVPPAGKLLETNVKADISPSAKKQANPVILLVEDDIINQTTLKRFLGINYTTIITDSSDEALGILKKKKVDLILMDISIMGSKNGLELTKELKASRKYSHIPVIAVTAHAFEVDKRNALEAGCDNYLAKPFSKKEFLDMVDLYLNKPKLDK